MAMSLGSNAWENTNAGANVSSIGWSLSVTTTGGTYDNTGRSYYRVYTDNYDTGNVSFQIGKLTTKNFSGVTQDYGHNNDGSLSPKVIHFVLYDNANSRTYTQDITVNFTTYPRYFSQTPTITLASRTETSYTFNWSTSEPCNWIRYHIDGSATWHDVFSGNATSGSFTVANGDNLTNGSSTTGYVSIGEHTYHYIYAECRRADSGLWSNSNAYEGYTEYYPYCNSSSNFVIGNNINLSLYNPLNRSVTINIYGNDNSLICTANRNVNGSTSIGSSSSEITAQYNSIPNSTKGTYKVIVNYGNIAKTRSNAGEYSVNTSECEPTFNLFEYEDINNTTLALTGNNKYQVKGYSTIKATITTTNKAVAKNGATMSKYKFLIGNSGAEAQYSSSETVTMQIANATSGTGTMTVYAVDSRGISTPKALSPQRVVYYSMPEKDMTTSSVKRVNSSLQEEGDSEKVLLTLNGSIWYSPSGDTGNFGQVRNSIKSASYRYKTSETSWSNPTSILNDITLNSNGTFEFEDLIQGDTLNGFSKANVYDIEVTITDELDSVIFNFQIPAGKPLIAYSKNGVSIMGKYDEDVGGPFQIEGKRFDGLEIYSESQEYVVGKWIDSNDTEYNIYRKAFTASLNDISNNIMTIGTLVGDVRITELRGFIRYVYGNTINHYVVGENSSIGLNNFETALDADYDARVPERGTMITLRVNSKPSSAQRYTISVIVEYIKLS